MKSFVLSYYLSQCLLETTFNVIDVSDSDFCSQSPGTQRIASNTSSEECCISVGSDLRAENFMETLTLAALSEPNPKIKLVKDETDGHLHVPNCHCFSKCNFTQDVSMSIRFGSCAYISVARHISYPILI